MATILDLRVPLRVLPPEGEKICLGLICTIMQNFTPIGAIVAEISDRVKKQQPIYPSILTHGR